MADIEAYLVRRASELAPTQGQREAAARSHAHLRELLSTGNIGCRIQGSYLSGSYSRYTAIRPLDDVDVIFEIDPTQWKQPWWRLLQSLPAPDKVLETFARAIRYRYADSRVQTQRRSVGLVMEHLQIDVVPAVAHDEREGWLYVPDREAGTWLPSAPSVHGAFTTQVNKACGESFKPLVRLLKGWNGTIPSTASQKSFVVETLAAWLLRAHPQATLAQGMKIFFDFVAWRGGHPALFAWKDPLGITLTGWGTALPDIGGTGSNLLQGADSDSLAKFTAAARVMRDQLADAERARDPATAWARIGPRITGGLDRV